MWRQSHKRLQDEHGTDLERYHQGYRRAHGLVSRHEPPQLPRLSLPPSAPAGDGVSPASDAPTAAEQITRDVGGAPADVPAPTPLAPVTRSLAPRTQVAHVVSPLSPSASIRRLSVGKPPRLWLAAVATLLIVAAVVSTLAAANRLMSLTSVSSATLSKPITISTLVNGQIHDPQGAAFSPDGRSIAVIGFQASCSFWWIDLSNCGHALVIYDARTGAVEQNIPLESLIGYSLGPIIENGTMPHPGVAISSPIHLVVSFSSLGWAPDGNRVAVTYTVLNNPHHFTADNQVTSGLLVVDVAHTASFSIQGDTGFFATSGAVSSGSISLPLWNLQQRYGSTGASLPAGLVYSWNAAGALYASQPLQASLSALPTNAGPQYPIGSPDGNAPFSLWQPGVVIGPGSANLPGQRAAFVSSFPVWSDDGVQATELTVGAALYEPAGATNTTSAPVGTAAPTLPQLPALIAIPARDAALTAVEKAVGAYGWALVGWNPDGTLLADIPCFSANTSTQTLELRSTTSGAVIGSIPIALGAGDQGCRTYGDGDAPTGAYPNANMTLAWSPDGTRLLVCDRDGAHLTLWNVR